MNDESLESVIHVLGDEHTDGRYTLVEIPAARVFTVTVKNINKHDDGIYFCGLTTHLHYIHLLNEIYLSVSGEKLSHELHSKVHRYHFIVQVKAK